MVSSFARNRAVVPAAAAQAPAATGGKGWGDTGSNGFAKSKKIQYERNNRVDVPFDFYLNKPSKDENGNPIFDQADLILLDGDAESLFFAWTHTVKLGEKKYQREFCTREFEPGCPLCARPKNNPAYCLFLSVADMREVEGKPDAKGNRRVYPWTRKVLQVYPEWHGFFERLLQKHGSLRGIHLTAIRDSDKPAHGKLEFEGVLSEQEIIDAMPDPEIKNREGKVIRAEGERRKAFDWKRNIPRPTVADLASRYGGGFIPGSDAANGAAGNVDEAWGEVDGGEGAGHAAPTPGSLGQTFDDDSIPF